MEKKYVIASEEGQQFAAAQEVVVEVGAEAKVELSVDQERAMVAAGWLEPVEEKNDSKKGGKS